MRNVTPKNVSLSLVIALGAFVFASETMAQGPLGQILTRMENHNKTLDTVQADVTMKKLNSQLSETDVYIGRTSYIPKTSKKAKGKLFMRLDWSRPEEQLSIIGDDYQLYKPKMNIVYVGKVDKAKSSAGAGNAFAFMSMSREQLRANYDYQYIGLENIEDGRSTVRLLLTPKKKGSYKAADLWIDGNGMPIQAKIVEQNNDTTVVTLSNIRKNDPLNVQIFKLQTGSAQKKAL